jgi:ABC-type transport system substrate-binding protein
MGVPENMRGAGSTLKTLVIEPLVYQQLDGTVQPWLAESFEWSNDYLTFTLHLRQGVTFHDGTPFNAAAVKWNWDKRTEHGQSGTADVASTEIIDDYTFAFHLKEYKNSWIDNLTATGQAQAGLIISPTAYETNGEAWANWHPIGTGAYKFKEYVDSQSLEIELNEDYWGERPYFDGMKWIYIADFVTAEIAFQAGEGDVIFATGHGQDLAMDLLSKTEKGYWPLTSSGLQYNLLPSGAKPASPFSKLQVRQALGYAVDRDKIVEGVYHGWALPKHQTCFSKQLPYDPNFKGDYYDPDKARQLLTEAGYPNGFKTTLYSQVLMHGKDIEAVQAYLKNVGIDAQIEIISVGKWIDMETNGWEDGILQFPLGAESYRGQVERDWIQPTEPNWSRGLAWETMYRPPELEELVQKYMKTTDIKEEKAIGQQIVRLIYDQAICIPLWEQIGVQVLQPWVKCTDTDQLWWTGGISGRPIERFWLEK